MGTGNARNASGLTNKAFDRHCQTENDDAFDMVTEIRKEKKKPDVIPFKRPKKRDRITKVARSVSAQCFRVDKKW